MDPADFGNFEKLHLFETKNVRTTTPTNHVCVFKKKSSSPIRHAAVDRLNLNLVDRTAVYTQWWCNVKKSGKYEILGAARREFFLIYEK